MPARDPEQIRIDIAATREDMARSLLTLKSTVAEATDWRHYVRQRPIACVAGAFALGVFLGLR